MSRAVKTRIWDTYGKSEREEDDDHLPGLLSLWGWKERGELENEIYQCQRV